MRVETLGSFSEVRNSELRRRTAEIIGTATDKLHERFPFLHPNHINALGVLGVALGSIEAAKSNKDKSGSGIGPLAILTASSLTDAFDGALARIIAKEEPEKVNFFVGQILDALSDRTQELLMGISRIFSANKRGDRVGEIFAYAATLTNPLPSAGRALVESQGLIVPEAGRGKFGFFGTRVGRTVTGIFSTAFPEVKGIPVQASLDLLTAASNSITAIDRLAKAKTAGEEQEILSPEKRDEANARASVLTAATLITWGAALFTYSRLKNRS